MGEGEKGGGIPFKKHVHRRSQMATMKEQGTRLGKSGEGWSGEGHQSPGNPGKRPGWGDHQHRPREAGKETGEFERKPALLQTQGNAWKLRKDLGQLLPYSLPTLSASQKVFCHPSLFVLINLATMAKLLLREGP